MICVRAITVYPGIHRRNRFAAESYTAVFLHVRIVAQHDSIADIGSMRFSWNGGSHIVRNRSPCIPSRRTGRIPQTGRISLAYDIFLCCHGTKNDIICSAGHFMIIANHNIRCSIGYLISGSHYSHTVHVGSCILESRHRIVGAGTVCRAVQYISRSDNLGTPGIIRTVSVPCDKNRSAGICKVPHYFCRLIRIPFLITAAEKQFCHSSLPERSLQSA